MMYIGIAIGSALGGMARYWCSGVIAQSLGETFPWHTLIINILGSFIIGFFAAMTGPDGRVIVSPETRQFVMIGICGGYTTFSLFSLESLNLLHDGEFLQAGFNIILSITLCLTFVWLGYILATLFNPIKGVQL
jgi:CrcB protein